MPSLRYSTNLMYVFCKVSHYENQIGIINCVINMPEGGKRTKDSYLFVN